jgi:hypothetical protein
VNLSVGDHTIKVAFYEGGGGWGMQAFWTRMVEDPSDPTLLIEDPTFLRHVINDNVYDFGLAVTHTVVTTAPFESNGNFNFNGPISLSADGLISSDSGKAAVRYARSRSRKACQGRPQG